MHSPFLILAVTTALACAADPVATGDGSSTAQRSSTTGHLSGDLFPEQGRGIEAEMERRRREAIEGARIPQSERPELENDELDGIDGIDAGLGYAGLPPCFEETPSADDLAPLIAHRALTRRDFRAPEQTGKPVVWVPFSEVGASVGLTLLCVGRLDVQAVAPGQHRAMISRLHFFSGLDPNQSWWNPEQRGNGEWILRHEQLHFDIAELYAAELSLQAAEIRRRLARTGETQQIAIAKARLAFQAFLKRAHADFEEIENVYDKETRHGTNLEQQTAWFRRVKQGLGEVRRGLDSGGKATLRSVDELAGAAEGEAP